ncbi:MAG: EAL domain-containing protein [Betaproteobacteria bacterium]|nr:EAL domain-containing protein [Betaproteobacteria bacterium]
MSASRPDGWTAAELTQAVERRQLELHDQPIVVLRSGRIAGAEALLRWRHRSLGLLSPERVAELRRRAAAGEQKAKLAREFGISRETLYQYLRTDG